MNGPMIESHFHWVFYAFNGDLAEIEAKTKEIYWNLTIEVIGYDTEENARIAAAEIVTREHFKLLKVWECRSCGYQRQQVDAMRELVNTQKS